ncbi:MAG: oxidative damage protection protein [Gammaproteobacteria bacterium]|nr:oxidative damage protection protein [Pseudomonadota bacterium]MCH9663431.1 oxidative damage protection protein [Gammaproteobacteria bacterium]
MASRIVYCVKLKKEAEGLERPPVPGELGQKLWREVSQEAWKGWLGHQTMLINEYRLTPFDPETREFLTKEMEKFFFGDGSSRPDGFVDPAAAAASSDPNAAAAAQATTAAPADQASTTADSAVASTATADSAHTDSTSEDTN